MPDDDEKGPASSTLTGPGETSDRKLDRTKRADPPQERQRIILRDYVRRGPTIPLWVLDFELDPRQVLLFALLGKLCKPGKNTTYATQKLLLRRLGFDRERTLRDDLRTLERKNLIAYEHDARGRRFILVAWRTDEFGDPVTPNAWTGPRIAWGVLGCRELSFGARLTLARLDWFGGVDGCTIPKHATLATELGCSVRSVQNYLRELCAAGFLEIESGRSSYKHNTYFPTWHPLLAIQHPWRLSDLIDGLRPEPGCAPELFPRMLDALQAAFGDPFLEQLTLHVQPATGSDDPQGLRADLWLALDYAVEWKWLPRNPMGELQPPWSCTEDEAYRAILADQTK